MFKRCVAVLCLVAGPALSAPFVFPDDPDEADFIAGEVIATFYHELGHALIDVLQVPVLGKEEDAADTLSVILMHDGWQEEAATAILTADATSYALRASDPNLEPDESSFADVHSLDIQRYYAVVCLFYGANPEERRQMALDLELPEEKLESCPYEYDQARAAWGTVLDQAVPGPEMAGLVMAPGQEGQDLADLLAEEVAALNEVIGLPVEVTVVVADCGEANAFYSPDDKTITMCNEYAEDLQALWRANP
ncbi:DUF4344 domain-containing metallopeptidase [Stagnihabitans tardus]|uniref:Metallopeptidase n=1 Tax=Stagnihabitans tardus TaxID=2699202 RepID=A0AAE4YCX5_9RHOB|nr:DUF4344 domain-containing metallopeptidase [Stagnihabitans tardus]NBZ87655.1 hypothetical protein [Stagnihabitans tardus]